MPGVINLENVGEIGRRVRALGLDATRDINRALLAGEKIIATKAKARFPCYLYHRTDHGRSCKPLAGTMIAEVVTKHSTAGMTVEGNFHNGPSHCVKFAEYGSTKMRKREYIQQSAEAKVGKAVKAITNELKARLGL